MSVIIRLQGLPWSASAMNIRNFFSGLSIPAGGVHIIGGEGGDAFIAFSSDDDARMAMKKNMCPLNGTTVQLFLSSKSEMQSVIDAARSGNTASVATPAGHMIPQQPPPPPPHRQQFQNMPGSFSVDNQNQNNLTGGMSGQQASEFNSQIHSPFPKNEWQGFQMYGGRVDEQAANQFQHNQRMPAHQMEGRFPSVSGAGDARGSFGVAQTQGKGFPENMSQFHDSSSQVHQNVPTAIGPSSEIPLPGALAPKQPLFGDQVGSRPPNIPATSGGSENPSAHMGGLGGMGRGQPAFQGQTGIGPNRNVFSTQLGRPVPGSEMPGSMAGNRSDAIVGRPNPMEEKSHGESTDILSSSEKFTNSFIGEAGQVSADGRKPEIMDWAVEGQPDTRFPSSQKMFDQEVPVDKSNLMNRDKIPGPDGRHFEQFSFRGEQDRARINRGLDERADPLMDPGANRLLDRQDREPLFPGRDIRIGSRFAGSQDPEGRFHPDRFSDDRHADDVMASSRYPPEEELQSGPSEGRPVGRFPLIRGRHDDVRFPGDERQFPPGEHRFPNEDRRLPNRDQAFLPEHERFPDGDQKFPPSSRGFMPDERRHKVDDRRFPPGPDGRRFPPDDGRFPPEERIAMHPDRMRTEEFGGRRPGDNPFAPEDIRFREREEELRRREAFGRGRRGIDDRFSHEHPNEGRPGIRPGFRDFEEGEEGRRFPPERRYPPERGFRNEEGDTEFRGPGVLDERRGLPRWERDRFEDWQEGNENYPRIGGSRGPLSESSEFGGLNRPGNVDLEGPMDMDQRAGRDVGPMRGPVEGRRGPAFEGRGGLEGSRPLLEHDGMRGPGMEGFRPPLIEGRGHAMEGMRGRGMEGMRGRGIEGMRGRGIPGIDGRRGPGMPNLMEENSFDYGHGSTGRGRPLPANPENEEEFGEALDYDNRFQGPPGRGGVFDRPQRGRGDPFFNRGRPGPPPGRGRGMDVDRRFEDAGPESKFNMDVDARNVGGRPDGPPLRAVVGEAKIPDYSVKPGSGKGLLGDAPPLEKPLALKLEAEKRETAADAVRKDLDNRSARRSDDRDRDHRPFDRRGREREDRRLDDRDRSRYRYERDRSDRRRSRSRERGGEGRRSRDRSSSTKKDHEASKSDSQVKTDSKKRCVRIKNLPAAVGYKDLRRFLQPIDVPFDGLKLISDDKGQRTGEAFVQFRHADDAGRAVRRNGEKLTGKIIAISFCSDEEFSAAVDTSAPNKKETATPSSQENDKADKSDKVRYLVQVKNLPLNITKQDIIQFFKGLTIENNGESVFIEFDQTGIATGNGFVEFKSDYDYKKALTQDGGLLGTVHIRVFPGKKEEADALKQKQQEMFQRAALRNASGSRMMQPRPHGQPVRPGLMGLRPGLPPQQPTPPALTPPGNQSTRASTPSDSSDTICVHIQGLPLLATPQDIREFFSDCQIAQRGINIAHDSRGKPLGEGFVEFKFKSDFDKAIKKDKTSLGRHIVAVKPIGKKEMIERLDNARGLPAQQGSQQSQSSEDQQKNQTQGLLQTGEKQASASPQQGPQAPKPGLISGPPSAPSAQGQAGAPGGTKSIPPGVLNKNWFYVRCQNFPPDISISEILTYFQGFRPIGESIRLHYSSEGKPTGNAVVGFGSLDEAQRALQRLNMKMCRQNVVTLHPA